MAASKETEILAATRAARIENESVILVLETVLLLPYQDAGPEPKPAL